jgi:hypothetical protein
MKQSSSWEASSHSASQENPRLLWNQNIHTVFIRPHHWSLFWRRWIQSTPSHPVSLGSTLFTHLRLGLPNDLFHSRISTKILCAFLIFPMLATCPAHRILDFITLIIFGEAFELWSSSLCSLLSHFELYFVIKTFVFLPHFGTGSSGNKMKAFSLWKVFAKDDYNICGTLSGTNQKHQINITIPSVYYVQFIYSAR